MEDRVTNQLKEINQKNLVENNSEMISEWKIKDGQANILICHVYLSM